MPWIDQTYDFFIRLHPFLMGANCALGITAALLFLRFYRKTHDRLFLFFSAAFAIMAVNGLGFVAFNAGDQEPTVLYIVRLLAFSLILIAIIDKNRRPRTVLPGAKDAGQA